MNTQELIEKSKSTGLSVEELGQLIEAMNSELDVLKNTDPEKYLTLVTETTNIVQKLNADLKGILEAA